MAMSASFAFLFCVFFGTDVGLVPLHGKAPQPYSVVGSHDSGVRTVVVCRFGGDPIAFERPDFMTIEVLQEGVVLRHPNFMGSLVLFHDVGKGVGKGSWKGAVILLKFSGEEELVGVREIASPEALQDAINRLTAVR